MAERCPRCGATPIDTSPGFSAWECGTVRWDSEVYDGPDCIRRQLTAARAEAERWRERAERLEVELRRVLPLAKGYAAQKPTMENWALCLRAEELLKGKEVAGDE